MRFCIFLIIICLILGSFYFGMDLAKRGASFNLRKNSWICTDQVLKKDIKPYKYECVQYTHKGISGE